MKRTKNSRPLAEQIKRTSTKKPSKQEQAGDTKTIISTGSTLLDLAISGGRIKGGGIPAGILVEIFGPSAAGKTVLLCEIAGDVQRKKGEIMFHDPEARLNKQFAQMFDLDTRAMDYTTPNTIPEVFNAVRNWDVDTGDKRVHGVFADSLAALSTDLEMESEDGDKMGMRRAKEFSEELRRTARILAERNLLMVCSNQVRESNEMYGPKYRSPGGLAIGFYASLRLRLSNAQKIYQKQKVAGKEVKRVIGIKTEAEVFKSSVWKPHRTAPLTILFDYGIDDIRENLQFIKDYTKNTVYSVDGRNLDKSMERSIQMVEDEDLIKPLKQEVIGLWEEIENKFTSERKPKQR